MDSMRFSKKGKIKQWSIEIIDIFSTKKKVGKALSGLPPGLRARGD